MKKQKLVVKKNNLIKGSKDKLKDKMKAKMQAKMQDKGKVTTKKRSSIKKKLILSYILCAVVPLVIVNLFSSHQSKVTVKETTSQLAVEMVKQTSANTSYYTDAIEKTITRIIVNDLNSPSNNLINQYVLLSLKAKNDLSNFDRYTITKNIVSQINYSVSLDETIDDIAIVLNDGELILSGIVLTEDDLERFSAEELSKGIVWHTVDTEQGKEIYVTKEVVNLKTGKNVGILVVKANAKALQDKINSINLFDNSNVSILNSEGEVICSNTQNEMDEAIRTNLDLESEVTSKQMSGALVASAKTNNGWLVVAEIPQKMLTHRIDQVVNIIWIIILIIAILAVFIGQIISKGIVDSVKQLKKLMKKAEEGDLTVVASIKGKDEMAELGSSFNHMIENIKQLLKEAKNTVEHSLEAAHLLKKNTSGSMEGFSQLALSIESIAEGSNSQAEDTQKSVAVMEELSNSIQFVIEDTKQLISYTKGTRQVIDHASENMQILNTTVSSTHEVSGEISHSITELNALTKTIGEIMRFLDDISERTNLLALNASIEAARAGAAGKGFAVVADEVRNLATQSKESSNHVKDALKRIESKVLHTSELVIKSNQLLEKQEEAVGKTHESLNQMIEGLQGMNKGLEYVNNRIELMTKCKDEMSHKIENIAVVNEENAATVEEVNALSEEQHCIVAQFEHLADELLMTINRLEKSVATFVVSDK